jgi:hypothetical protein
MKKKPEKEKKEQSVDFYDWFDSLEFEITPLDKNALLTDKSKEKQSK